MLSMVISRSRVCLVSLAFGLDATNQPTPIPTSKLTSEMMSRLLKMTNAGIAILLKDCGSRCGQTQPNTTCDSCLSDSPRLVHIPLGIMPWKVQRFMDDSHSELPVGGGSLKST